MTSSPALPKRGYAPGATGPLAGVRVLDLSRLVAGNSADAVLADFGAEVIKVEPPAGDTLRAWRTKGVGIHWKVYARNKKSLCLDLRKPEARELLLKLVPAAHDLVESFRPGTLEEMGLSPDVLLAINPRLVIVRISGWGQDGPYRKRPGFGTLVEGMSGFASMNGFADREPVLPPMYLADSVAGLYGASAVMIALREVEINGGSGQVIDLPLLDPLFSMLGPQAGELPADRQDQAAYRQPLDQFRPAQRLPVQRRRYVGLSASTREDGAPPVPAIGRPELSTIRATRTNAERLKHAENSSRSSAPSSPRAPRRTTSHSSNRRRSPSDRSTTSARSSRIRT